MPSFRLAPPKPRLDLTTSFLKVHYSEADGHGKKKLQQGLQSSFGASVGATDANPPLLVSGRGVSPSGRLDNVVLKSTCDVEESSAIPSQSPTEAFVLSLYNNGFESPQIPMPANCGFNLNNQQACIFIKR